VNAAPKRRALGLAVRQRGSVPVTALAAELGCSEMTIRRDLNVPERDETPPDINAVLSCGNRTQHDAVRRTMMHGISEGQGFESP
jgi:hypothetical protein